MSIDPPSAEPHDLRVSSTPGVALRSHSRRLRPYLAADPAQKLRSAEAPDPRAHRPLGTRRKNPRTNPRSGNTAARPPRCRAARVGQRGRRTPLGRGGGSGGWRVSAAAARRRARGRGAQGLPPTYGYLRPTQPSPPQPHPRAPLPSYLNIHTTTVRGGQAPARNVMYDSALVLATRAGAPSPGGSQPTSHDWTCSTGTGASQHHSRHLPHTHRGGHVGSSQHNQTHRARTASSSSPSVEPDPH